MSSSLHFDSYALKCGNVRRQIHYLDSTLISEHLYFLHLLLLLPLAAFLHLFAFCIRFVRICSILLSHKSCSCLKKSWVCSSLFSFKCVFRPFFLPCALSSTLKRAFSYSYPVLLMFGHMSVTALAIYSIKLEKVRFQLFKYMDAVIPTFQTCVGTFKTDIALNPYITIWVMLAC